MYKIVKKYHNEKDIKKMKELVNQFKHNSNIRFEELPKPSCIGFGRVKLDRYDIERKRKLINQFRNNPEFKKNYKSKVKVHPNLKITGFHEKYKYKYTYESINIEPHSENMDETIELCYKINPLIKEECVIKIRILKKLKFNFK